MLGQRPHPKICFYATCHVSEVAFSSPSICTQVMQAMHAYAAKRMQHTRDRSDAYLQCIIWVYFEKDKPINVVLSTRIASRVSESAGHPTTKSSPGVAGQGKSLGV